MTFSLSGKTVFIAGETGMVGRAMQRVLAGEDCTLLSAPHAVLDLTNQRDTLDWFQTHKPDVVIHAAGRVGGIKANNDHPADFIRDNVSMAHNVIEASYQADVQKLVYLGSSCIYPREAQQPITEDALLSAPLEETNQWYAVAKIAGLKMCQAYRRQYGRDFVSVMPTNLYGPYDRFDGEKSHVIPALMRKLHQAKQENIPEVSIWGTGKALREFLYVDDLARALVRVSQHYSDEVPLNIGSGEELSIRDLCHLMADVVGYRGALVFDPSYPDGTPRKCLDSTRIRALGWQPEISLRQGLESTYNWLQAYGSQ